MNDRKLIRRANSKICAALLLGYIAFEKLLRPVVENHFPELVAVRAERERKKGRKAETKGRGRARKAAKPNNE